MALNESVRGQIGDLLAAHRVVLFMKGTRRAPQCGFSAQVVQILDELLPSYETVDVLQSSELRDGIKEFSQWPTIPQLYVGKEFVGGCDIVRELYQSGKLHEILGADTSEPALPAISMSDAAAKAFAAALGEAGDDVLRLAIDREFQNDLYFGPRQPGDIDVRTNGLTLTLDRATARRADGLRIDFVDGPGGGFKLENPNAPPKVVELGPRELEAMLDRGEIQLFDVRPDRERALASIEAARPLDAAGQEYLFGLDRATPIAFHCHVGMRSRSAAEQLIREGFTKVYNLAGGIDAWSREVDAKVPRY